MARLLADMDTALFRAINDGMAGPWSDWLMFKITSPSTWYIPIAFMVIALVAFDRKRGAVAVIAALAAIGFGDALAHYAIKPFFGRIRPCEALENVHLLVGCTQSLSFPSNHAVNSLALAGAIGAVWRKMLWALVPIGVLVCVSRVAVGAHYLSDVVIGAILGFGIGWGFSSLAKKYFLEKADDGAET